ncbi:MAG: aminotransferase class I/II-fold pyridoxal phosphate-dependent enzyme [Clostridia bacterium]|nr:aminotransferase class I/II-fold pyridoxal phosphate-dependent enzyme [Clostridia bacterium]MBQ5813379.1 aminotransferase class I/II-fold pyridoxal phosphate-dependent enzyme [Clostridia bacterium]
MDILTANREELLALQTELKAQYDDCCAKNLKLNMARGKPGADQLDLSRDLLTVISTNEDTIFEGTDLRNYGGLDGIPACKALFAELLGTKPENILIGGNASLTMMYDNMMRLWVFGDCNGNTPWSKQEKTKFLCPVPGYDRHFAICEQLGIEMIPVPMNADGPDMDMVEKLVSEDATVKGIWCVPKYSNPSGAVYSNEVIERFAALKPAAPDFKIMWDNAYVVHHLTDEEIEILDIFEAAKKHGNEDMIFMFASTSKITFPGAGVACMVASEKNMKWTKNLLKVQAIGPDKINQARHVKFFGNAEGVKAHMKKHAAILAPKFQMVLNMLEENLQGTGASWLAAKGGYFISFDMPGCASRIFELCKNAGLVMTDAGATWPYGKDPQDSNLRIAPSLPPVEELKEAMKVFCICAKMAAVEKRLAE